MLTWIWFALHAKRLRDAGRSIDLPAAIALLYVLSVALLVIVAVSFINSASAESLDYNGATALGLILFVSIIVALLGSPQLRRGLADGDGIDDHGAAAGHPGNRLHAMGGNAAKR